MMTVFIGRERGRKALGVPVDGGKAFLELRDRLLRDGISHEQALDAAGLDLKRALTRILELR
jgi:hypothetical protein